MSRENGDLKETTNGSTPVPMTSADIAAFDADLISKLSSSLATNPPTFVQSTAGQGTGQQASTHQLIASATVKRERRHAASEKANDSLAPEADVTGKAKENVTAGIPEKFITGVAETKSAEVENRRRATIKLKGSANGGKVKQTNNRRKPAATNTRQPSKQQQQQQQAQQQKKNRARGTLYGLSTLKRQGNVRVNAMADHTTVKSNFVLGPLVLKVEKSFGRGVKKELRSATATTTEMIGRISLRIVNGAATLHSIKVQQPKQVMHRNGMHCSATTNPLKSIAGSSRQHRQPRSHQKIRLAKKLANLSSCFTKAHISSPVDAPEAPQNAISARLSRYIIGR